MGRKHSPGCNCCCCGEVTLPTTFAVTGIGTHGAEGWTASGSSGCCYRSQIDLTGQPWTNVCSAATRSDTRSAGVYHDIYSRLHPVTVITDPGDETGVVCSVNKDGTVTCTVNGEILPSCNTGDDSLCDTIHETVSQYQEQVLAVRWRKKGFRTYYYRVNTACGGGEETCKWVVVSQMLIEAQSGYLTPYTYELTITQDGSDCCGDYAEVRSQSEDCDSLAELLQYNSLLPYAITRAKVFDSQPSGTISFAPGDTIDCENELDCITVDGTYDTLEYNSIDTGWGIDWTAPSCSGPFTTTEQCISFAVFSYTGYESCVVAQYPYTLSRMYAVGSLFETEENWQLGTWQCFRSCRSSSSDPNFSDQPTGSFTRTVCRDMTSSRTTTGYNARSITLTFPTWEVVFTP